YGADGDVLGGLNAFYLLRGKPEVYGLPSNPKLPSETVPRSTIWAALTGVLVALGALFKFRERTTRPPQAPPADPAPGVSPCTSSSPTRTGGSGTSCTSSSAGSPPGRTCSPASSSGSA